MKSWVKTANWPLHPVGVLRKSSSKLDFDDQEQIDDTGSISPAHRGLERNTTETRISIKLTIEGGGHYKISTGIRFFDHMLELFYAPWRLRS